jgi:hypothetical protein
MFALSESIEGLNKRALTVGSLRKHREGGVLMALSRKKNVVLFIAAAMLLATMTSAYASEQEKEDEK